jgi:hypothetical protein
MALEGLSREQLDQYETQLIAFVRKLKPLGLSLCVRR